MSSIFAQIPTAVTESKFFPVRKRRKRPYSLSELVMGAMPLGFYASNTPNVLSTSFQPTLPARPGNPQERHAYEQERRDAAYVFAASRTTRAREGREHAFPQEVDEASPRGHRDSIKHRPGSSEYRTRRSDASSQKDARHEKFQQNRMDFNRRPGAHRKGKRDFEPYAGSEPEAKRPKN